MYNGRVHPMEGSQVEVCVIEAISNSIQHAYQGNRDV